VTATIEAARWQTEPSDEPAGDGRRPSAPASRPGHLLESAGANRRRRLQTRTRRCVALASLPSSSWNRIVTRHGFVEVSLPHDNLTFLLAPYWVRSHREVSDHLLGELIPDMPAFQAETKWFRNWGTREARARVGSDTAAVLNPSFAMGHGTRLMVVELPPIAEDTAYAKGLSLEQVADLGGTLRDACPACLTSTPPRVSPMPCTKPTLWTTS
jgi:hypothetical protein